MEKSFDTYRKEFSTFYHHLEKEGVTSNKGHGFEHDITVASIAVLIAEDEVTQRLAWVAAMLHSLDHKLVVEGEDKNASYFYSKVQGEICKKLALLPTGIFQKEDLVIIEDAVLHHGERSPNNRSQTLHVLQEADMLANMSLDVAMRGGQYRPNIPAIELDYIESINPLSSYSNPQSVFDAIQITITEYVPKITLKKAIVLAEQRKNDLELYVEKVRKAYRDVGLSTPLKSPHSLE